MQPDMPSLRRGLSLVVFGLALAMATGAPAQQSGGSLAEPAPRLKSSEGLKPRPAPQTGQSLQPCPEYGAGFVRQPGSSTCVKLGVGVTVEQQWRDRRSQLADPVRTQTQARLGLDARTQTEFGPLRAVISTRTPLQP